MIRERISRDLKDAIKATDTARVATLRLILAAIKDRDIALRTSDSTEGVPDHEIFGILGKMVKQREESTKVYEEAGRLDLAAQEQSELRIIRAYLPKPLSESEVQRAIACAIHDTGAHSIRDMGRVMAHLKAHHTGRMDFSRAGAAIKNAFR